MCCAWAQMIDYDKITLLLGAQSATGKVLSKGDIVGVSALAKGQNRIAEIMGDGHSGLVDKFATIESTISGSAILIKNAKVRMICEVLDVLHLPYCIEDAFLVLRVTSYEIGTSAAFLGAYEV
jgi:flavin reductase (DIM6/NTAB) family NADH-FMN oxidoreductase RutF